jgi:hypothetical protein
MRTRLESILHSIVPAVGLENKTCRVKGIKYHFFCLLKSHEGWV